MEDFGYNPNLYTLYHSVMESLVATCGGRVSASQLTCVIEDTWERLGEGTYFYYRSSSFFTSEFAGYDSSVRRKPLEGIASASRLRKPSLPPRTSCVTLCHRCKWVSGCGNKVKLRSRRLLIQGHPCMRLSRL